MKRIGKRPLAKHLPPIDVDLISARVADTPKTIWIELTSRCPFDCVFCSRKLLRGKGQHLDFSIYEKLLAELVEPETIRLNYSGESSHYPQIVEACSLAALTGARVELVSALASLPWHRVDALAQSGLTRLTVSLHTLDPERFKSIYNFSNVEEMTSRIERLVALSSDGHTPLEITFAFVAMRRNLNDLQSISRYAAMLGLRQIDVHPVIRRDPIPETFEKELDNGVLREDFLADLSKTVAQCRDAYPQITFNVSTPELENFERLGRNPREDRPAEQAHIIACEQDPWSTVHVLANGDVVSCEVRDQLILGNLREQTLSKIWVGKLYTDFRNQYFRAKDPKCQTCPYKKLSHGTIRPSRILAPRTGIAGLLQGWHDSSGETVFWSHRQARAFLAGQGRYRLVVRGMLPMGRSVENRIVISGNGVRLDTQVHPAGGMHEVIVEQDLVLEDGVLLEFEVSELHCPKAQGIGNDPRQLGFALLEARLAG